MQNEKTVPSIRQIFSSDDQDYLSIPVFSHDVSLYASCIGYLPGRNSFRNTLSNAGIILISVSNHPTQGCPRGHSIFCSKTPPPEEKFFERSPPWGQMLKKSF